MRPPWIHTQNTQPAWSASEQQIYITGLKHKWPLAITINISLNEEEKVQLIGFLSLPVSFWKRFLSLFSHHHISHHDRHSHSFFINPRKWDVSAGKSRFILKPLLQLFIQLCHIYQRRLWHAWQHAPLSTVGQRKHIWEKLENRTTK